MPRGPKDCFLPPPPTPENGRLSHTIKMADSYSVYCTVQWGWPSVTHKQDGRLTYNQDGRLLYTIKMAASYIQSKLPSVTYSYNQWTPRTQSKGAACYIQSRRPPHLQSRWPPVTYNNNGRLIYNLDGRLSCAIKLAASYIHNQDGHLTYNHDGHLHIQSKWPLAA